jgi:hypothetical protein
LIQAYRRHYWGALFRFASKEQLAGVTVGTMFPEHPRSALVAKMRAALAMIAEYDLRALNRLQRLVTGVLVFDTIGTLGTWIEPPKLILLNEAFVAAPDTTVAQVAATIVHETTHAWLEARGFAYREERRRRIEAICCRAQAAFARRVPDGLALAIYYQERSAAILDQRDDAWSDSALVARDAARLRALHVPQWFVRLYGWMSRRAA